MTRIDESAARRMLPRWRSLTDAAQTSELVPADVLAASELTIDNAVVHERVNAWQREQTIAFAGDLLGSAFVLGDIPEVRSAATFVLERRDAPAPLRRVASNVLTTKDAIADVASRNDPAAGAHDGQSRQTIALLRKRLRLSPRNPIAWTHLAREYAIVGQQHHALRAIATAVALAKENRFVLRAAVRAYVHFGDPETAWSILRRSLVARTDPWLMAAEIGTAMVTDRTPRSVKDGRSILSAGRLAPSQTTELASALASLELDSGSNKQAKKLFRLAIVDPNDNTIAQVEWATRVAKLAIVDQELFSAQQSYEALTWQRYVHSEWAGAYRSALAWLGEEPFSSRPVQVATFVASVLLEDYAAAEVVGTLGLAANRDDQTLLNNLAFTLASAGKTSAAISIYNRMRPSLLDRELAVAWLATGGLIQFRLGLPDAGRDYYRLAMDLAERIGANGQQALACCYLAREEKLAHLTSAEETLNEAIKLADQTRWSIAKIVAGRLRDQRHEGNQQLQIGVIPNTARSPSLENNSSRLRRIPVF